MFGKYVLVVVTACISGVVDSSLDCESKSSSKEHCDEEKCCRWKASLSKCVPTQGKEGCHTSLDESAAKKAAAAGNCTVEPTHKGLKLFAWVREGGGFIHPSLRVNKGMNGRGVFTSTKLAKGEKIVSVPAKYILKEHGQCHLVKRLRDELNLQKCSEFWPHISFMKPYVFDLPSSWDDGSLDLLKQLPPYDWRLHLKRFEEDCTKHLPELSIEDATTKKAFFLSSTRAGPEGMQPLFDAFNHGYQSTWHYVTDDGNMSVLETLEDIPEGAELLHPLVGGIGGLSESDWRDVAGGKVPVGAPESFRDHGFIEETPTLWWFKIDGRRHNFIEENDQGGVRWLDGSMNVKTFIKDAEKFLNGPMIISAMKIRRRESHGGDLGKGYRNLAAGYHAALEAAVKAAIAYARAERTEL